jgi:hypothetical protein
MGKYHHNADEIPSIGRALETSVFKAKLVDLQRMLRPGEVLVGYYDAAVRRIAPVLEQQKQVDDFYQQYVSGQFIRMAYYAVPEEKLQVEFP